MELSTWEAILIGIAPLVLLAGTATIFIGNNKDKCDGSRNSESDSDDSDKP